MAVAKVFIVGSSLGYIKMFLRHNWQVVGIPKRADLIQFTGGEDIDPRLYDQKALPTTYFNSERDRRETIIFKLALKNGIPMAGICRGGQFLNVMCGGDLWQHCDGHNRTTTHTVKDSLTDEKYQATSSHHQIMRPGKRADIFLTASEATFKERCTIEGHVSKIYIPKGSTRRDTEGIYYKDQRVLCFQPHPEYGSTLKNDRSDLSERYFSYIHYFLKI